jgi:hypothetical protein
MDISAASDPLINNGLRPHPRVKPGVRAAGGADALSRARNVQVSTRTPDVQSIPKNCERPSFHTEPALAKAQSPHPPAIATMFAAWGSEDSPHDLSGDGNVGMRDFFDLMKQLSDNPQRAQVDALFRDWGRTEPTPHDFTRDGEVGIRDFFSLMRRMSQAAWQESAQEPPAPAPSEATPEVIEAEIATETEPKPAAMAAQPIEQPQQETPVRRGLAHGLLKRLHAAYGRAAAENVARSMMPLLAGVNEPDELRESLDQARLPHEQRQHVLDRLAAWNPRGVSFNAVG